MSNENETIDIELHKMVMESNRDHYAHSARKRRHANRVYWILFIYLGVVVSNAIGVVVLFILTTLAIVEIPYVALSAWAVGTGGLGAGSLSRHLHSPAQVAT